VGTDEPLSSQEYALIAAEAAADKKASDILVLDVSQLVVITEFFVIVSGSNDRQVKTIAQEIEHRLKETGLRARSREGEREGEWVLLDFGDLVVHVFQPAAREFYRIEHLWDDAPRIALPESVTGPAGAEAPAE
jgi:ribosome-associated protein